MMSAIIKGRRYDGKKRDTVTVRTAGDEIWLYVDDANSVVTASAILSRKDARRLRDALTEALDGVA